MNDTQKQEKFKEYSKKYREKNKEKFQKYRDIYYAKKKEEKKLDTYIHEHISADRLK